VRAAPSWPAVIEGRAPRGGSQYALSKLAAVAFAAELQRRLVGTGVAAVAVNPGGVASDIWRHMSASTMCFLRPLQRWTFLTTQQGSRTSFVAATATPVDGAGAAVDVAAPALVYLSPYAAPACAQRAGGTLALLFDLLGPFAGPRAVAPSALSLDARVGGALWDACEGAISRWSGL
jgi:NAD(P)-dependent dehydrogenase (short-subunit alcohol dehydrogenase family)